MCNGNLRGGTFEAAIAACRDYSTTLMMISQDTEHDFYIIMMLLYPNALSHDTVFLRHPMSYFMCFFSNPYNSPFDSQNILLFTYYMYFL